MTTVITLTQIETHLTMLALNASERLMTKVVNVLDFAASVWDSVKR